MPRFTTTDGLSLHYTDVGEGRPVLCLAGLTRNGADFSYLAPHLPGVRLIRMDYRGRGQSEYASHPMTYNILREGEDAIELLDHLGLAKATVIGTSRGGLISMALSATHPERLQAVVLNDIGPVVDPKGLERIMEYVGKTPPFPDLDAAAQALAAGHAHDFPGVPVSRWREQADFMWEDAPGAGLALRYDPKFREALIGQAGVGEAPDLWALFDGLKAIPLAAIRGANSDLLTAETLEAMQARHPGLIAATVPDRGHVPFLDEHEALSAIHHLLEQSA